MTLKSMRQRSRTPALALRNSATPIADVAPRRVPIRTLVEYVAISTLKKPNRSLRKRKPDEASRTANSLDRLAYDPPILLRRDGRIVHGAHYYDAYVLLGHTDVPVIFLDNRTEGEIAALKLALDAFDHGGELDRQVVVAELKIVIEEDPTLLNYCGPEMAEIDVFLHTEIEQDVGGSDVDANPAPDAPRCTVPGDIWIWPNGHRLICGNAREAQTYERLMEGKQAKLVITDVPYGTKIAGTVSTKHGEFLEGSNKTEDQMVDFFQQAFTPMLKVVAPGAWVFAFIDWKSLHALTLATRLVGLIQKSLIVIDKMVGNRGGLYKNQAEFALLCKWGDGSSINNVQMGRYGRSRSNVWQVHGYAGFRPDRKEALDAHPTVKPLGAILPALLDASNVGDIVLDPFSGAGSLMLAAERVKRVAYCGELDPKFVDVTVHRMHKLTGQYPVHAELGLPYPEVLAQRLAATDGADLQPEG